MAEEQVNPFEQQPQPKAPQAHPAWAGMTELIPQGGQEPYAEGSNFQLGPEAMQMMWAPHAQPQGLMPPQVPPPQPQINPLI